MAISNYVRGRYREYRCQRLLEAEGYKTMRAASSQGCFDVAAIHAVTGVIRFVQVKSGSACLSKTDRATLQLLANAVRGKAHIECWKFRSRCRFPDVEVL